MSVFLKVLSSLLFFLSGWVWKEVIGKNNHLNLIVLRTCFSIAFITVTLSFLPNDSLSLFVQHFVKAPFNEVLQCFLICCFSFFGLYFYTKAIQKGRYTMVASLSCLTGFFAAVFALFFLGQQLNSLHLISFGLLTIGLTVYQWPRSSKSDGQSIDTIGTEVTEERTILLVSRSKELFLIIMFSLIWGISFPLCLLPIQYFGVMHFTLFLEICVLLCASVIMGFTVGRYLPAIPDKKVFWGCMLIGGLVAPASYLSNLTLASMPVMVNVLIALLFEGAVIIIGRTRFKERLQWRDFFLIVTTLIACLLILL